MKILVGLGNPEEKYKNTRHNVGFMFLDAFPAKMTEFALNKRLFSLVAEARKEKVMLVKPTTYMNSSGKAVGAIANYFKVKPQDIYVVHDDLDLSLGEYKIQQSKGPKVHGGINSIEQELSEVGFWRVRIGVDNRDPDNRTSGEEYVLQSFASSEREVVDKVIQKAIADLEEKL